MASVSNLIVQIQADTTAWEDISLIAKAGAELYVGGSFSDAWSEPIELTNGDACLYCGVVSEYRADWPWCCGCGAPLRW